MKIKITRKKKYSDEFIELYRDLVQRGKIIHSLDIDLTQYVEVKDRDVKWEDINLDFLKGNDSITLDEIRRLI